MTKQPPNPTPTPAINPRETKNVLAIDGIFASLTRRRDRQLAALGRHRRTVSIAKFALPALAAVLLAALAVLPNLHSGAGIGRISYKKESVAQNTARSRMSVARYQGVDAQGEKFTITAQSAEQISHDRLRLAVPKGDITTKSGTWIMLNAQHGLYHQDSELLKLAGKVTLYRADGTTLRTRRAAIDIKGGTATGHDPVAAFGPFGKLDATSGFLVKDRGADILFKGDSHLTLDQVNPPAPDAATGSGAG